jgi:uncharacterized protein YlxW (UPF0749 family)
MAPARTAGVRRVAGYSLVALAALLLGFGATAQLRSQLVTPYNRVDRNEALVRSVQVLERSNDAGRRRVGALRGEIAGLEAQAARRSDQTQGLQRDVAALRDHAGLTAMHGPGVTVEIRNGRPSSDASSTGYLATYQDVQDVVNLLFAGGAEGIAVSGRRITPLSGFQGSAGTVEIDQGPPIAAPFRISAVGNRAQMEQLLGAPGSLGDLRHRQREFGVQLSVGGAPDITLPAFDGSLEARDVKPL